MGTDGRKGAERIGGPYGEKLRRASREGKKDALEKELAEKLRACGSESKSHRHLTLTLRSLCEEKIRDVCACDAEDEKRDGGECNDEELEGFFATRGRRIGGFDMEAVVFIALGMRLGKALSDDAQFLYALGLVTPGLRRAAIRTHWVWREFSLGELAMSSGTQNCGSRISSRPWNPGGLRCRDDRRPRWACQFMDGSPAKRCFQTR